MAELPDLEGLPEAVPVPKRRGLQLVWLVPLAAALIGGWLAVQAILERGPTVTISFLTAEGLEPGKTRVRYKDVDIGEVKSVAIAKDRRRIVVTAQFVKEAEPFLKEDTRFWVVRPRFSGGQISGIATLLSGAHIAMDVGQSERSRFDFKGLETIPILTGDQPGRQFTLEADDMGSLEVGSPVYFRRIKVGQVVAHELDASGDAVNILVFVQAPYDRFVTREARFWNASGVDLSLDANGVKMDTQSLASILTGGIAFESPDYTADSEEAPANTAFRLLSDRATALKSPDGEPQEFVMYFADSLRGLSIGAPVDFRGIVVGEVLSVGVRYEPERQWFHFPVRVALYPRRLGLEPSPVPLSESARQNRNALLKAMTGRGFRAQLRTGSLLTGQLYVALDFFPDVAEARIDWNKEPLELPTVTGTVEELQQSVAKLLKRLDKVPLEEIGSSARSALVKVDGAAQRLDGLIQRLDSEVAQVAPESRAALADLRKILAGIDRTLAEDAPLQRDLRDALGEATRAARSLRSLADTLDRNPESLLGGRFLGCGGGGVGRGARGEGRENMLIL
jgi:paraquat-inducible protein B